jgi:hypothetical protein
MTDRTADYFRGLAAAAGNMTVSSRWRGAFAGHNVEVAAAEDVEPLLDALTPRAATGAPPSLTVRLWHEGPSPIAMADAAWKAAERWRARALTRINVPGGDSVLFDPIWRSVTYFSVETNSAGVWIEDPKGAPSWVRAAPLLRVLDWWGPARGLAPCHGGAFAWRGAAALFIGAGGAGKSTLATSALGHDLAYLGDDYVLLESGAAPRVHSLYRSMKLAPDALKAGLPPRTRLLAPPGPDEDKSVLLADAAATAESAFLAAVVAPFIAHATEPRLEPISPAEALRIAVPSTLSQLSGGESRKLAIMAGVFARAPCFRLHLARDAQRNRETVTNLLKSLQNRRETAA